MSSVYPKYLDKFTNKKNETGNGNGDFIVAEHVNDLQDSIIAIEGVLGVNPQGTYINIAQRLVEQQKTQSLGLPKLAIYKGDPAIVNGVADIKKAARQFAYFDNVILTGINVYTNPVVNVMNVIGETKSLSGNTSFFGEIDAGLSTAGYSPEQMDILMNKWKEVGADGVYLSNFGYDKGSTRDRQNKLIDLAHEKDLFLIINNKNINEIVETININMNPEEVSLNLGATDIYLHFGLSLELEGYVDKARVRSTANQLIDIRKTFGCKLFVIDYIEDNDVVTANQKYYYGQSVSMLYSLDGYYANRKVLQDRELKIYVSLPIVGDFYDSNPIITDDNNTLKRISSVGEIEINFNNFSYSFKNIKIPLGFIDLNDNTKIPANKIEGTFNADQINIDVVATINGIADGSAKINAEKIDFSTVGNDIIESINVVSENPSPKINSGAIGNLSVAHIREIVDQALKESLQAELDSGTYSASFIALMAAQISAINAYIANLDVDDLNAKFIDGRVIKAGSVEGYLFKGNTITSDKLTIQSTAGTNKWTAVSVNREGEGTFATMKADMVLGKKVIKRAEYSENTVTKAVSSAALIYPTPLVAMWETSVLCDVPFTLSPIFKSKYKSTLIINNVPVVTGVNNVETGYSFTLNPGWNTIRVITDYANLVDSAFNLGFRFSDYALDTEKGEPTGVIRMDGYADKVTQITGDTIETGTILVDHLQADTLSASNIKTGTLQAGVEIEVGTTVKLSAEDGVKVTGGKGIQVEGSKGISITEGSLVVLDGEDERVQVGKYDTNKYGIKVSTKNQSGAAGFPILLNKDGLSAENFSIKPDGTIDLTGKITATEGQFIGQVIVGKETANPIIILDGSIDNNPEIKISVDESIVEYEDATGQMQTIEVPGGYIRLSKEGIQVSENGIDWTTKLHANGLTVGTTDIGDGVITTDKINVEEVNAGLVNAGMIKAMEAYIKELTVVDGNFENILVDMLQAKFINTTNISVYSEAKDGSANTGFLFIDSGGLLVSSKVKNELDKIPLDAHLVKIDRAGIKVSADGGQTWDNKLTGAGLNVGKAEITSVYASAIVTGKIDINTSINVDDKVFIDGLGGITVTGGTGAGVTVKEGHVLIKDGSSDRIIIGKQDDSTYGIKLNTTNGVITLDKRGLISPNFTIGTTGKIDAKDGNFSGTIKTTDAVFGLTNGNHVTVDSEGIVIGTGSIVDTRDELKQAVRLDSEGIVAKQGIIGGLNIVAELDGQGEIIDSVIKGQKEIYNEVGHLQGIIDQFTFHSDTIEVTGAEAVTINSGTLVVKEDNKVYVGVGKIDPTNSKYGIRVNMHDPITKNPTGKYIQLDQDGLRAFNGTINTININKDGNISVSGQIDATSGTLGSLTVQGQINIDNGSIKAGDVIIDKTGIEGTGFSLNTGGVVATQGSIGGWTIGDTNLSNGSINLNTLLEQITIPGVIIGKYEGSKYGIKAGDSVLNDTGITGTGYSLTSSGVIATKGTIGGWTLASTGLSKGNIAINSSTETITIKDEVMLGKYEGLNYGLKAGTVILNKSGLTGTGFSIGEEGISATTGYIGSWLIENEKLSSGNINLDADRKSIWIGPTYELAKIKLNNDGTAQIGILELNKVVGGDTYSLHSANFKINSNGNVSMTGAINATSGTFSGRIEATEGWFGNEANRVSITVDGLTAGNVNISKQGIVVAGKLKINNSGIIVSDYTSSIQLGDHFLANSNGLAVSAGKIANWDISEDTIHDSSSSIILDASSKQIQITDQVVIGEYDTGEFGIKAGETILNANGIEAKSGNIAGWSLTPTTISSGNIKLDSEGVFKIAVNEVDKIRLNNDGSAKLGLLNVSADGYITSTGLTIDNTGATFDGEITAASGTIAGWTIGSGGLSATGVLIDSANKRILLGSSNQISISSTTGLNVNSGQFLVDLTGKLTAKNAVITGSITTSSLIATGGEIGNLTVKGNITAGDTIITTTGIQGTGYELKSTGLTATKGKIGGWTLGSTTLSSGNLTLDSTGIIKITVATVDKIRFNNDGSGKIGNLNIGTDGSLTSTNFSIAANGSATFNGKITSTEGSIAGWAISPQSISAGKITLDKDGKILLATNPSDITEYNLIDSANFKVTNKGNVSLTGGVTATSGLIGGWTVNSTQIKAGHLTLDSTGKIVLAKGAQAAYDVITSPSFKLDSDGKVTATSANVTGTVNATAGYFGTIANGVKVNADGLEIIGTGLVKTSAFDIKNGTIVIYNGRPNIVLTIGEYQTGKFGIKGSGFELSNAGLVLTELSSININEKFKVNNNGEITATGATLSGNITATSGSFTGRVVVGSTGVFAVNKAGTDIVLINKDGIAINAGSISLGTNFSVNTSGNLVASNVDLTGKISATSGKIGGWTVSADEIKASHISLHKDGRIIFDKGIETAYEVITSPYFKLNSDGAITATSANITGTVNANAGYFGTSNNGLKIDTEGLEIIGSGLIKTPQLDIKNGSIVVYDTKPTEVLTIGKYDGLGNAGIKGDGFLLNSTGLSLTKTSGINIGSGKFIVTSAGAVTATSATVTGSITATGGSFTGRLTVGTAGAIAVNSAGIDTVLINKDGITIKAGTIALGTKFSVDINGKMLATDVDLTGKISATSGTIGGWAISTTEIKSGHMSLHKDGKIVLTRGTEAAYDVITSPNFKLNSDGNITATSANVTGTINATAGYFGALTNGVKINSDGLEVIGTTGLIKTSSFDINKNALVVYNGRPNVALTLGEYEVGKYGLKGNGFILDSAGLTLSGTKGINIGGKFVVTEAGVITATSANISGSITATGGSFAGRLTVGTSGAIAVNNGTIDTVLINKDGIVVKAGSIALGSNFSVDTSGNLVASNVTLTGKVSATSGAIGGWTVTGTQIKSSAGEITLDSAAKRISVGSNVYLDSNGLTAEEDTLNYLRVNNTGLRIIKNGTDVGAAITKDGIRGQLLTNQSVSGTSFDVLKPKAPTTIAATSVIEQLATGEYVNINVTWVAPTQNEDSTSYTDAGGFKVYLKQSSGLFYPEVIVSSSETSATIRGVKPNTVYQVAVTAFDKTGNESLKGQTTAFTTVKDTVAPSKITGLSIIDGLLAFTLRWTKLTGVNNYDIDYYEINQSTNGTTWTLTGNVYTDFVTVKGLDYNANYYFRVRAVDLSGNTGVWSDALFAGKPKQIGREDIVAGTITADELNIGSVVKSINTQQTTLFHFDGTLQSTQGLQPFVEIVGGEKVVHQSGFFKKEARFGASISMEEDTENLIAAATNGNAHLKNNSNGWVIGTGSYIPINGVEGVDDGYLEVPYDGGGQNNKVENIIVEAGKEYTISIYAKSIDSNSSVRIDAKALNGTAWNGTTGTLKSIITKATGLEWKRYSATFTIPAGSNTTKIAIAIMQSSGAGKVAVDSFQLEQRAYATSFVNGIKAEGYVDYYAPAILKRDEGTISFWMKSIIGWDKVTNNNHADTPYQDNLFIWGKPISSTDSQANSIYAKYERNTKMLSVKYNGGLNTASFSEFDPDSWVHFAFTWKNNEQILFINGKEMSRKTAASMSVDPSDLLFRLGYIPRLDGSLNVVEEYVPEGEPGEKKARSSCLFDELRIDRVAVNQEEIKSWFVQESSFYDASAQIDADSQNISAANASVTINNEGITIRDGKLHVISQDGQTLITGGRLQVNGLDIGIAQSDNNVYNGSFTVGDTSYGPGDVVQTPRGVEVWGAKYWKSKRSSGPMADQALLGATWNTVPLSNFIDPHEIWTYAEMLVDSGIRTAFKIPPNILIQIETEKALLTVNPMASAAEKNACKLASKNAMDAILINPASNIDSIITSSLGAYVAYKPLVLGVVNIAKVNPVLAQTPEAITSFGILSQAPTTPIPIVTIYQGIMRAVCNDFVDNYNLDTAVVISALSSANLVGANAPYLALVPGMIVLMENSKVILKQSIESAINEEATNKYDNIMNFHMGYLTWNNINGDKQMKVYHIASDEEEQKYGWQSGAIYEIESDIVSNIIKGQEVDTTPENIGRQIDPTTGLFKISTTPFTDGNTLYYVSPDGNHLGRIGYCELGVSGLNAQVNSIEQDLSKLKTYVDGNEEHFKQHTFSFHGIWNTEEDDSIVKSDTAQLAFEVEELIPMLQALPDENGMAKIIPSYEVKMKKEVEYNAQLSALLETQIQIESNVPGSDFFGMYQPGIGPLIVSLLDYADKTILYNTNPITKQAMEIGNMNILDDKISYKIQAIRNADTIIKSVAETLKNMAYPGAGKAYVPYEYVPTGQKGVISVADKTCYLVEDQSYIDTSTKPTFTYESAVGEDNGNQVEKDLGWLTKKGDFISVIFQCQSEVDAKLFALQANDGANFNMYVDGVYFSTGTAWMPKSRHSTTEVVGFYSGLHMMTVAHTGEGWIYNKNKDNRIGFGGVEVFDWHSAKTVIEKIIDMHPLIPAGNKDAVKLELANKVNTQNKKVLSNNAKGEWEIVSIAPSICNSLDPFGYHWLPERTPVKYKAKCTLSKLGNDDEVSRVKITGIQCELGTNPSYTRISNGEGSIPGLMIQPYNKEMWRKSGIQTRHLQEHTSSYFLETGIYDRHIADRNVTSKKISYSAITNDHISNGNITYRKTRVNRTKIDKTIITVDDFIDKANLSSQEIMSEEKRLSKYLSFLPKTRLSDKILYSPSRVEYGSELLFENGQLLEPTLGYYMKKKIALVNAGDLWEVASIIGTVAPGGEPRDLTAQEVGLLMMTAPTIDLYGSWFEAELAKLRIEYVTEITFVDTPDASDVYTMQYWQEL